MDGQCSQAQTSVRLPVASPVKTIIIEFKGDDVGKDILMDRIELNDVDIRHRFVGPATLDASQQSKVREGNFLWAVKYTFTA